ncbi:hypothetical protein [Phenylobacterium sp.]|uniref:hypothetical protein n=1 Tax=Phenylobacterium sp. TaxID=1871053 RepID=UPI0025CE9689|nr:hypothetical protein [Phenylobacterium sp.]
MADQNLFLQRRPEFEPEAPRRYYALFDQASGGHLFFEAVSADFFDDLRRKPEGVRQWAEFAPKAPIYVIELKDAVARKFERWAGWTPRAFRGRPEKLEDPVEPPPTWFEFWLQPGAADANLYFNLYGEGRWVQVNARRVSDPVAAQLSAAFSLHDYEATQDEIEQVLANLTGTIEWVGVYDVGQGGANGLCDSTATPLAYFDLGGAVLANTSSFPASWLTDFCYAQAPPVVLSHWDWDHWSSGNTFPTAQTLDWIVPNQSLGAVHTTFASGLASANKLWVWPASLPDVRVGKVTIRKCTGSGRNHSGLALEVVGPQGQEPILLTGDARYTAVPGATGRDYTSVVAPHHGADMKSSAVPTGLQLPGARTAYSFGQNNTFQHPRPVTQKNHHSQGWPHKSQGARTGLEIETVALRPGLGHIGLGWVAQPRLPQHSCGAASCAVDLKQT